MKKVIKIKIIIDSSNLMSVLSLNSLYIVTQNQLQSCYDEMEALYDLLGNYIKEMTALVGAGEGVTQVNRNDVYWNLQFMYGIMDEIKNVRLNNPLPTEDGLGKTDAQIQAMKNNYKKADSDILCIAFPSLHTCINNCKTSLKSYYEDKIVEYENKDDFYRKTAKKIRKEYSDEDDRDLQFGRDFGNVVTDLFTGVYFTVTELLSGLLYLSDIMTFDGKELLALITMLISPDPPNWAKKLTENERASYDLLVALLSDPVEVIESFAQQVNDEYDKNGLVFYVGSILADIAITKGTSKVIKATKAGSVAEDVAKFSDDVPKYYDDLDNGMKGLDNADEVKPCDGAGGVTGKGGTNISNPFFKQAGGSNLDDFMTPHAQKHAYNPNVKSTKNKTQFGENIDVAKLREDTMLYPDKIVYDSEHNVIKYMKEYDFNISTPDTPTGSHRVFINLSPKAGKTNRNSQFPYYGGDK